MNPEDIQKTLEGGKGDEQQFQALKFIIGQNIERAFQARRVRTAGGFEGRGNLLNYSARRKSNHS